VFGGSLHRGRCPIGLDLGAHSIKMIQLERRDGRDGWPWSVVAAASRSLPQELPEDSQARTELLGQLICEMLADGGFTHRQVVSALPARSVQYKNLRLPPMPPDELQAAVEWEAADRMYFDRGKVQLQYFDAGPVRQGEETRQEIILMAASIADIESHLELLTRGGLDPEAVEVAPSALARSMGMDWTSEAAMPLMGEDGGERSTARLIIDIGHSACQVLVTRQGRVAFFKLIDIGADQIDQAVADQLNMSVTALRQQRANAQPESTSAEAEGQQAMTQAYAAAIQELSREVQLCLRYYSVTFRGRRPDHAMLVGGASHDSLLAKLLGDQMSIRVAPTSPFTGVDVSSVARLAGVTDAELGPWAVAAGLSMRGRAVRTRTLQEAAA